MSVTLPAGRLHNITAHLAANSFRGPVAAAPVSESYGASTQTQTTETGIGVPQPGALKAALEAGRLKDVTIDADYKISDHLPGPLQDQDRDDVLLQLEQANATGSAHLTWMEWQEKYGDAGLNSNIVVPHVLRERAQRTYLTQKVYLSDPDDCIRIAKAHTQKEPNFQLFMGDSVISATDNTVWRKQRNHMVEAFLPTSSLSKIFPISVERAEQCAEILKRLSQGGNAKVNMTEFFLNETQQQLHLALFGERDEDYDENYNASFRDAMGGPPGDDRYKARHELAQKRANRDRTKHPEPSERPFLANLNKFIKKGNAKGMFAAPSDVASGRSKEIAGPLSAVLATQLGNTNQVMPGFDQLSADMQKKLSIQSDLGNAFIFAFAGHDTTGHTLTWLTYELAKNPEYQSRLVAEVDAFWAETGDRQLEFLDMKKLPFMTRCITETLRLWPVVPNGTFRQLSYDDEVKGPGGKMVKLPKGTIVQITTAGRHRNPDLWGETANQFNPDRKWEDDELWHDQVYAARNPHSRRFSPFTHTPRDCIGKNFAQMEMRTILTQLFKNFTFELTDSEKSASGTALSRGKNNGTMGPMDVDFDMPHKPYGMHVYAIPRNEYAAAWEGEVDEWPESRGILPQAQTK